MKDRKKYFRDYVREKGRIDKEWKKNRLLYIRNYNKKPEVLDTAKIVKKTIRLTRRTQLFEILGGMYCRCTRKDCFHLNMCHVSDIRCLQFDHINGGGTKQYKKMGGDLNMLKYYLENPQKAKKQLQPLCANCNWVKKHANRESTYK